MRRRRIKPTIRKKATSVLNTDTKKVSNDNKFDMKDYNSLVSDNITLFWRLNFLSVHHQKQNQCPHHNPNS